MSVLAEIGRPSVCNATSTTAAIARSPLRGSRDISKKKTSNSTKGSRRNSAASRSGGPLICSGRSVVESSASTSTRRPIQPIFPRKNGNIRRSKNRAPPRFCDRLPSFSHPPPGPRFDGSQKELKPSVGWSMRKRADEAPSVDLWLGGRTSADAASRYGGQIHD